jgi:hypothetical protein
VALVRTDVSEELSASFIRVTRIGELRTTSQKTPFFIVTAVKTSNLTALSVQISAYVNQSLAKYKYFVRLEVFTAVTMKNGVFWDVMPHGSSKIRHFGGM